MLKCLNGVTDLIVHDFVSFFYLTGVASQRSWGAVRTRPIGSTTFYVCFAISIIVLLYLILSIFIVCNIIVLVAPAGFLAPKGQKPEEAP